MSGSTTPAARSVREAQTSAAHRLAAIPDLRQRAAQDAALLLRHTLGLSPARLLAWPERLLTSGEEQAFEQAITRRLSCEPVQYITGEQEFYGLALQVTPAVLIPRPETELLVQAVLAELAQASEPVRIADVGTGSGAIAIALAANLPNAELTALDISPDALEVARENARRHQVETRVRFVESDLLAALPESEPLFHAIVSNPPYVAESDRRTLHPEVRDHEPATALFAGSTGLDIYHRLIPQARAHLQPGGLLAMEFGYGQEQAIEHLLTGWRELRFLADLQGIPRTVLART